MESKDREFSGLPQLTDVVLRNGTHGTIVWVYDEYDDYEVELPPQPGFPEWVVKTVQASEIAREVDKYPGIYRLGSAPHLGTSYALGIEDAGHIAPSW